MLVLGLNDGPNASACLLQDGIVTHCIQEERLSRVKKSFLFSLFSDRNNISLGKYIC